MELIHCTICLQVFEHNPAVDKPPMLHPFYGESQLKSHIRSHFEGGYSVQRHGLMFMGEVLLQGFVSISVWATLGGHVLYAHRATHYYIDLRLQHKIGAGNPFNGLCR